ncbi:hypothetical protein FACS189467_5190 [Bacteroidia bacterium]|nr:hypothetical protein FACS189467_5190 [Bacteroidia bacterium]
MENIEAIKEFVLDLFNKIKSNQISSQPVPIGQLTEEGRKYLSKISGLNFKQFVDIVLHPSDLRHIYNDHYGNNEKDRGNNIPLTDEDITGIVDIISNPDYILFLGYDSKTQSNKFSFLKSDANGTYNLLEVYGDRRGNLTAKSFFKTKKGINQRVVELQKKHSLLPTSETYFGASLPLETTIPTMLVPMLTESKGTTNFSKKQENSQKVAKKAVPSAALAEMLKQTQEETPAALGKKRGINI